MLLVWTCSHSLNDNLELQWWITNQSNVVWDTLAGIAWLNRSLYGDDPHYSDPILPNYHVLWTLSSTLFHYTFYYKLSYDILFRENYKTTQYFIFCIWPKIIPQKHDLSIRNRLAMISMVISVNIFLRSSFGISWCFLVFYVFVEYLYRNKEYTIAVGHTIPNAPDPIRTLKLSGIRQG